MYNIIVITRPDGRDIKVTTDQEINQKYIDAIAAHINAVESKYKPPVAMVKRWQN